ncbi:hypothetical protein A5622_13045 [Mycobacterium sp. 1245801.1]|nr:hypothetical protein A5622_13045 [Mycobacterium sp. 1245801.1]
MAATKEMQRRLGLDQTGHFNIQTAKKSRYIETPVFFTVEGHMSNMFAGPVADTATQLEREGLCHHQPIGYNNGAIPFDNASGVQELARLVGQARMDNGVPFPAGTPWVLGVFSQGGIVGYDFYEAYLAPGKPLAWREADRLGTLAYGNPCRGTDSIAPWAIGQIKKTGTHGLDPYKRYGAPGCPALPPNFMDDYREGDIFAENGDDQASQLKASIYQAVARGDFLSNPYGVITELVHQLPNVISSNIPALITFGISVFQAIVSGIVFLADQPNPHYSPYDISGGLDWVRNLLS